jgi:hypothetical protein
MSPIAKRRVSPAAHRKASPSAAVSLSQKRTLDARRDTPDLRDLRLQSTELFEDFAGVIPAGRDADLAGAGFHRR